MSECGKKLSEATEGKLSEGESDSLLLRAKNLYKQNVEKGMSAEESLRKVQKRLATELQLAPLLEKRNRLLALRAKRNVKETIRQFPTMGEGLLAVLEGSSKPYKGARNSIDYQTRANFGKYFGRLVAEMEQNGVSKEFFNGKHEQDIFRELWQLGREGGTPGITGNEPAAKIAKSIHSVGREMISRQNESGAYIRILEGYVMRQTHDIAAIRHLGGIGHSKESQSRSYHAWRDFVLPLLDTEQTFNGADPELVLRNVHQGLYSGIHGPEPDLEKPAASAFHGKMADKVSRERVIHFKDADSAYAYNQRFGMKSLRDQVVSDIRFRSRSMSLMENLGPSPRQTFEQIKQELAAEARNREDAAKQVDSLNAWAIDAAMNEVSGINDHPVSHTLARVMHNTRTIAMMAKMGGVVLSSFGDKAFLQSEMAYQGISTMGTLAKQLTTFFPRSPERLQHLRLLGVALDGILGNVMGRYSFYHPMSGKLSWAQKRFFDLNFMNFWNDANKAGAAELMAAHLGEHAHLKHSELPEELSRALRLYGIENREWAVIRSAKWTHTDGNGATFISPESIRKSADDMEIVKLLSERKMPVTTANKNRVLTDIETSLRTYLQDRVDYAVPSPGAAETRITTLNSRAGTPLGEAVRLIMMFKSFPITILQKTFGRELYGRGARNFSEWLMNDHKGKFQMLQMVALATIGGYLSSAVKDALKGRSPKPLIDENGKIVTKTLNDAALRGGGLGVLGDLLFSEYDRQYHSFLGAAAGPVVGQLDPLANVLTKLKKGEDATYQTGKLVQDNLPYANLFYIRPVLDYFVLWNLQEAMNPGSLRRMERKIEEDNSQSFFVKPSEVVQ